MNMTRFQYEVFERGLEEFIEGLENPAATRALRKLKFMVLATAWTEFRIWHPATDREQAMAWAWEDMVITFSGYGDSASTGAVIHLWTAMGSSHWEAGKKALNQACMAAAKETSNKVPRRYLLRYRTQTVRTPAMGFDLPAIVPTSGPRLREWAKTNDKDPDTVESQMALIEEYERMGLIQLGTPDKPGPDTSGKGPKLRLLWGGGGK